MNVSYSNRRWVASGGQEFDWYLVSHTQKESKFLHVNQRVKERTRDYHFEKWKTFLKIMTVKLQLCILKTWIKRIWKTLTTGISEKQQFKTNCPQKECLKCKWGWLVGQVTYGKSHEQMTYNSDGVPMGEDSVLQTAGKELHRPLQAPS